jgi:hypothetical protein
MVMFSEHRYKRDFLLRLHFDAHFGKWLAVYAELDLNSAVGSANVESVERPA